MYWVWRFSEPGSRLAYMVEQEQAQGGMGQVESSKKRDTYVLCVYMGHTWRGMDGYLLSEARRAGIILDQRNGRFHDI